MKLLVVIVRVVRYKKGAVQVLECADCVESRSFVIKSKFTRGFSILKELPSFMVMHTSGFSLSVMER